MRPRAGAVEIGKSNSSGGVPLLLRFPPAGAVRLRAASLSRAAVWLSCAFPFCVFGGLLFCGVGKFFYSFVRGARLSVLRSRCAFRCCWRAAAVLAVSGPAVAVVARRARWLCRAVAARSRVGVLDLACLLAWLRAVFVFVFSLWLVLFLLSALRSCAPRLVSLSVWRVARLAAVAPPAAALSRLSSVCALRLPARRRCVSAVLLLLASVRLVLRVVSCRLFLLRPVLRSPNILRL